MCGGVDIRKRSVCRGLSALTPGAFAETLRAAGLVDDAGDWAGGETVLVQAGDVFDRWILAFRQRRGGEGSDIVRVEASLSSKSKLLFFFSERWLALCTVGLIWAYSITRYPSCKYNFV